MLLIDGYNGMEIAQHFLNESLFDFGDVQTHTRQFDKNKYLIINNFLDTDFVNTHFLPEVAHCEQYMHRVKIGSFKKSGSVGSNQIQTTAPHLFELYHSAWMKRFVEQVVGEPLHTCPSSDLHSVALYYYTEPGDHIGVHYDKSFYRGRRYTVLLGLIQDSIESKLVCYPGSTKLNRKKNPLDVYTHPGTLIIFDGDSLWHEVTPLGKNEKRVILTMEYVTDSRMSWANQWVSTFKDRLLYFGKNK